MLIPKPGILALDRVVAKRKIPISPWRLPDGVVLLEAEGRGGVEVPLEADEVTHGGHGVLEDDVHAPPVDFVDGTAPFRNVSEMGIEKGQIQWTERIC